MADHRRPTKARRRLLAGAVGVLLLAATASAQRQPGRSMPTPIDFATSQDDNLYSLLRSQDDIHELETALAELEGGEALTAVRRLHELLRGEPTGVVPVAPGRFQGMRNAVVTVLANLSPAARELYEQLVQREAGNLLERPLTALSRTQVEAIADRFPTSTRGLAARLLLGDRALEAGDGVRAAAHYRMALDATAIGSADERRVNERLACAAVLCDPASARAASAERRLFAAGDAVLGSVPPADSAWLAIGGGRSGATPMAEPVGQPLPFWSEQVVAPGFDQRDKGELAMFPAGDLDGLYVNTGQELIAFDPLRQGVQWISNSPMRDFQQDDWRTREQYDRTINQDMVLAPAVGDDVVVCALQVPDNSVNVDFQASFRIMSKIPQRRLFAFSRRSGKQLWAHFDELDGPDTRRFRGHDACGPPLVAGDTVYAPIHDRSGAIAFSIAAYDLHTGKPKWRQLVCSSQQDVNMFGNARMEFAASPLALAEGALFGAANLGIAFALDAANGSVRWISAYEVVRMPRAMLHGQADRQVYFANNAPVVVNGVVCLTPLDSQYAIGIDVDSGSTLWRLDYDARLGGIENRVQWLAGAIDDEFVLGGAGIVAVQARPESAFGGAASYRQLVRPDQLVLSRRGFQPARPAVTADHVWVPSRDRLLAFDRAGNPRQDLPGIALEDYVPGNLLLVDGIVASLRNRRLDLVLDPNALLARSQAAVAANPDDPEAILRLAYLSRALLPADAGVQDATAVQELYRRGLEACIARGMPASHPTRQALQRELFDQALAVADAALQAGSPETIERLAAARDLAPDDERWIEVQTRVLASCRSDRHRFLAELERLEQRAPTASMPSPLELPVAAFVLWQRAIASEPEPAEAVALWQQLLERHGGELVGGEALGGIAEASIARLIDRHGARVYAAVAARADAALAAAGRDRGQLERTIARYPNSEAARQASRMLLDLAVESGDLGSACAVLARALRVGEADPGILRRVQVAAARRGNQPLGAAMARALQAHGDTPSDWPADGGRSFAQAARGEAPLETRPLRRPELPEAEVARIPLRSRQEYVQLVPNLVPAGFEPPADAPFCVHAGPDIVAYGLPRDGQPAARLLFAVPVDFVEHVILCGDTLVVPDTERVLGLDATTGEVRWQVAYDGQRRIESLGVTDGVLHLSVKPVIPDGESELVGIEPLSGTQLFSRSLGERELKPKPAAGQLLLMSLEPDEARIERIDPVTGRSVRTVPLAAAFGPGLLTLRPESIATQLYPQWLTADAERVYLPIDGRDAEAAPQVVALDAQGALAWRWRGSPGAQLVLNQLHASGYVVVEFHEQRPCRAVVLDAATGAVAREVELGLDATVLNWERTWLDNPLPPALVFDARIDRQSRQHQLVCLSLADGPTFAMPLGAEDGEIERSPQFGDGFVTFGVRPQRLARAFRLYAIDLATQKGAFADDRKNRFVESPGAPHGMAAAGAYTVVSTGNGLILLGRPGENR